MIKAMKLSLKKKKTGGKRRNKYLQRINKGFGSGELGDAPNQLAKANSGKMGTEKEQSTGVKFQITMSRRKGV